MVEIAPSVQVKVVRHTVADLLSKPVPAASGSDNRTASAGGRRFGGPLRWLPRQAHGQEVSPAADRSMPRARSRSPGAPSPSSPSACSVLSLLPNFLSRSTLDALPEWLPQRQITLGLDLQGGSYLLLEVDLAPVYRERLESMVGDVRAAARGADRLPRAGRAGRHGGADPHRPRAARAGAGRDRAEPVLVGAGGRGPRLRGRGGPGRGRTRRAPADRGQAQRAGAVGDQPVAGGRRRRIDELGTREASIQRQGADRILVQVPESGTPRTSSAFWAGPPGSPSTWSTWRPVEDALAGRVPPGSMVLESSERDGGGASHYVVKRQVELSGES